MRDEIKNGIESLTWDELNDIADILDQVYYLNQRYSPSWIDETGFAAYRRAIEKQLDRLAKQAREELNRDYERSVL